MTSRRPIIVGNWKMNLGGRRGQDLARTLIAAIEADPTPIELAILAPFTALPFLQDLIRASSSALHYGAQDISSEEDGAFTGEISGSMLADIGACYVLAGHSERRARHHEHGASVNAKVAAALRHGLIPIVCVGEELDVRRAGSQVDHTLAQINEAIVGIPGGAVATMLIAYEPVWAIGTGEVATPDDAQEVCSAIRSRISELYSPEIAAEVRILYGGSVKPSTSASIVGQPDIDGALVGSASLDPEQLLAIWRAAGSTYINPASRRCGRPLRPARHRPGPRPARATPPSPPTTPIE
jgi:triosephosphate isomerase (TIM)